MAADRRTHRDRVPPGLRRVIGGIILVVLGLLLAWLVFAELRLGTAGGAMAEAATRAEFPAAFWLIVVIQALTALTFVAAGARTAGVPLPVAPRPLLSAALVLGVALGGWTAVEFALKMLGLTRELGSDPGLAMFVRIGALVMLAVLAYFIWEFGLSEIAGRLDRRDGEDG